MKLNRKFGMNEKQTWRVLLPLLAALLSLLILSPSARAQGGPPMLTADPATPGDGLWEVNFLSTLGRSRAGLIFETPMVEVNGEVCYRIVGHGPDEWEYGILFAREVVTRVELMGELHGSALRTFRESELFFNTGSRVQLTKNAVPLVSAGRTIRNAGGQGPQTIAAFGIQFNFRKRMHGFARNR